MSEDLVELMRDYNVLYEMYRLEQDMKIDHETFLMWYYNQPWYKRLFQRRKLIDTHFKKMHLRYCVK